MESKPECKLVGTDGNVFALIKKVEKTLIQAGMREEAEEFKTRVMETKSYNEALQVMGEYVSIH